MAIVISGVNNNDKITASDGTIDLLSGVNYAGIITAPAFTTPGNFTAGHLNIGSGIQLGNAGVATATTFVGNLTGNVNATSNLLLQIGGSEKFRVFWTIRNRWCKLWNIRSGIIKWWFRKCSYLANTTQSK